MEPLPSPLCHFTISGHPINRRQEEKSAESRLRRSAPEIRIFTLYLYITKHRSPPGPPFRPNGSPCRMTKGGHDKPGAQAWGSLTPPSPDGPHWERGGRLPPLLLPSWVPGYSGGGGGRRKAWRGREREGGRGHPARPPQPGRDTPILRLPSRPIRGHSVTHQGRRRRFCCSRHRCRGASRPRAPRRGPARAWGAGRASSLPPSSTTTSAAASARQEGGKSASQRENVTAGRGGR